MYYIFNRYQSPRLFLTWVSEIFLIFVTALATAAIAIRFSLDISNIKIYDTLFIKTIPFTAVYIVSFYYFDLFAPEVYRPNRMTSIKVLKATGAATIALFGIFYIVPELKIWHGILFINTIAMPAVVLSWRLLFKRLLISELPDKNVIILGSGELAIKTASEICKRTELGLSLVGLIDDDAEKQGSSILGFTVIGGYGDIKKISLLKKIDLIIVALHDRRAKLPMAALLECKMNGISIEEGETFNERMTGKVPLDHLKPSWMVFSDGFKTLKSKKIIKRISDLVLAVVCLLLALPILVITAVLIKLESKGPVLFKQVRVGEHGKAFSIYKFRSMRHDAELKIGPVWACRDDNRITRVGRVIRKLRIDELPQIFNVLKGNMSFVGPRPERPYFVEKLKEVILYYEIRTVIKPGITGWAQIKYPYGANLRDALEKLQYEIYYIKNMSPLLDLMIFFWTIKVIVTGKGAR